MADKPFGVDQLDILGTGTPTISAPNQLNLDCHTVAISTSTTVGNNITVTGNVIANGNIVGDNSTNISGIASVTATTFYGSGANLTGISAGITTTASNIQATWDVVNNSASAYRFTGPGQDGAEDNPDVYLVRGQRYRFSVNASGHPFQLRVSNGGSAYTDGVTNNGAQSGNVEINVQHDAPARLFYQCTNHGGMVGNIFIIGGSQIINAGVVTFTDVPNPTPSASLPSGTGGHIYSFDEGLNIVGGSGSSGIVFQQGGFTRWRIASGHFRPHSDSTVDIGTNTVRVRNGYFDTLYGDGSNLTGISAGTSLSGSTNNTVCTVTGANAIQGEANLTFDGTNFSTKGSSSATSANAGGTGILIQNTNNTNNNQNFLGFYDSTGTSSAAIIAQHEDHSSTTGNLQFGTRNAGTYAERMRIDSEGRLLIGQTSALSSYAPNSKFQLSAIDGTASFSITRWSNNGSSPYINLGKSRGGIGSYTIVQDGDRLGQINFTGADGSDLQNHSASIAAYVDGTPGSNDMPGRLIFATASDGGTAETERLRITSGGVLLTNQCPVLETTAGAINITGGTAGGRIAFQGTTTSAGAGIAEIFAHWGTNKVAGMIALSGADTSNKDDGQLAFYTSSSGPSVTERLRIDSSGNSIFKGSGTDVTIKPTDGLIDFGMDGRTSFVTGTNACYIYSGSGASGTIPAGTLVLQSRSNVNRDIVMVTGSTPTERLRIKSNGNIGLNNSSPAYLLDVTGASVVSRFTSSNNNNVIAIGGNNASHLAYMGTNSSGDFLVATGGSVTTRLNINTSGRVRLSGVPGVAGSNLTNVSIESDGNLCTQTSLREYKTNITSMSDTSWLYNLNPVTFNWKKKTEVNGENVWEDTADDNGTQYGLIAEEVEAVKKEFCYYDNDNKLSGVHYDRLIAPLLKGLQEQKTEIDALKNRITTLEGS
mgnify:CR=1 FL=1